MLKFIYNYLWATDVFGAFLSVAGIDQNCTITEPPLLKCVNSKCKFFVNQMSPIIVGGNWWNILIILETTEEQKIWERSSYMVLKCVVTLFSYSISHNFPVLKLWNDKRSLKNHDSKKKKQGSQKDKHLSNQRGYFCLKRNPPEWRVICLMAVNTFPWSFFLLKV